MGMGWHLQPFCCWNPAGVSGTELGLFFSRAEQLVAFSFTAGSNERTEV